MQLFTLLFLVCAVRASFGYPNTIMETLNVMKNMTDELVRYSLIIPQEIRNHSDQDEKNWHETFKTWKNKTLNEIESIIKKSNKEEKKAELCYKTASENLNGIYENADNIVGICRIVVHSNEDISLNALFDHTMEMSDMIIKFLEKLIQHCETMNGIHIVECLTLANLKAEPYFEIHSMLMNSTRKSASKALDRLPIESALCTPLVIPLLSQQSMEIKNEARNCTSHFDSPEH